MSVNREAPTHDTPMASPQGGGDSIRRVFLTLRRSIDDPRASCLCKLPSHT